MARVEGRPATILVCTNERFKLKPFTHRSQGMKKNAIIMCILKIKIRTKLVISWGQCPKIDLTQQLKKLSTHYFYHFFLNYPFGRLVPTNSIFFVYLNQIMSALEEAEAAKKLGNDAFVAKKFEEAVTHYSKAIELCPDNAVFYSNRSACYASKKMWQESYDDAKMCIQKDYKFIKGYYRLASAQSELGLYDEAMETLNAALKVEPESEMITKTISNVRAKKAAAVRAEKAKRQPKQLDEHQQKEFMELQQATSDLMRDQRQAIGRFNAATRELKIQESTLKNIEALAEEKALFRTVGKAFIAQPKAAVVDKLTSTIASLNKQAKDCNDHREFLERRIKSNTLNLQEMIGQA
jgi:tetratricopeptide (TPR) repeat protein